ncbi:MAG: hypothetical protein LBU70_05825 [Chitinispirillales bacterium]|jgi:hypothetical protein|nr:hypothetical protein [Chitinispirillales bacterium]
MDEETFSSTGELLDIIFLLDKRYINPAVINLNYLLSLALFFGDGVISVIFFDFFGDGALPRNAPIR